MAAGSGGGAKTTSEAEGAQAFFCGILDYFSGPGRNANIVETNGMFRRFDGNNKNKNINDKTPGVVDAKDKKFNYDTFVSRIDNLTNTKNWKTKVMKDHVRIDKGLDEIETFLRKKPDWFRSSINIAESLQKEIKFRLGNNWNFTTKDYFFIRGGGSDSLMNDIQAIFDHVNSRNGEYFSNINRWCPADIYLSSKTSKNEVGELKTRIRKLNNISFDRLNYILRSYVKSGKLLPVSLKQNGDKIDLVPIKMFNSGPPMKAVNQEGKFEKNAFKDDGRSVIIALAASGRYEMSFFSSMDMYVKATKESAKTLGYNSMKLQIRDKAASSSNRIEFGEPNSNWKFGIQGMVKLSPASAQGGGIGGGVIEKKLNEVVPSNEMENYKIVVSGIASKFKWSGNKFTFDSELKEAEKNFINEFSGLSDRKVAGTTPTEKIIHCLKQLHKQNVGTRKHPGVKDKLKKNSIDPHDRYLVARWFLTKYYCMKVKKKLQTNPQAREGMVEIFRIALSLDKTGKSGKPGGGSMFFVKAG